ncbi:hypothetical protein LINPERPRIM_LOCUS35368 [Linum perenne]
MKTLTGRLAVMNRFFPKSAERKAPFFATLKGAAKFAWSEDCSKAFEELKSFLTAVKLFDNPCEIKPANQIALF